MYEIDPQLVQEARARIARERQRDVCITLQAPVGVTLTGARVHVKLTRHAFRFGCNGFGLTVIEEPALAQGYEAHFARLLNYATLPFYWGSYEPERGQTRAETLRRMAQWCRAHGVATKGHPLAWHEVFPRWATGLDDAEVLRLQRERVQQLVSDFRGLVDTWDVVNEATVSERFDNAFGRYVAQKGAAAVVEEMLRLAHAANPQAELLYNDFNIRAPECDALVSTLIEHGAPLSAIGIQSHMHTQTWPMEEAWAICERYARFGRPLHFTELTVLSGRAKDPNDRDWHRVRTDWLTTPEGEEAQARYGEALYTLLYSHPAVQAITWWDFSDYAAWQGAPAGLIRRDMTPKPLYERLIALVWGEWATNAQAVVGDTPRLNVRCTAGEHRVELTLPSGAMLTGSFTLAQGTDQAEVALA